MKRIVVIGLILLLAAGMLFAGGKQEETTAGGAGEKAQEEVTITWVTHPVIFGVTGEGELFKEFTEDTGIKVEVVTFPTEGLAEVIPTEFIAGSDAYDVMNISESFWTEDLAQYCEPMDNYIKNDPMPDGGLKDFSPGMIRQFRVPQTESGAIYGIPNRMSVDILYYRKDLFDQYNISVPKTLDEYYDAAKKLTLDTDGDGKIDIYGALFQALQGHHGVLDWYVWASALGADLLTPPDWQSVGFNNKAGIGALALRNKMYEEGIVPEGVLNYTFDDAINLFAQGKVAMTMMYSPYWATIENPEKSNIVGKVGYAPIPKDPAVDNAYFVRGWGLMINKASKNKEAAWKFVKFLTSKESQIWTAVNHGNAPSRFSVYADSSYQSEVPAAEAIGEALKYAKIQPNTRKIWEVFDILAYELNAGTAGDKSAEQAIKDAAEQVSDLLED